MNELLQFDQDLFFIINRGWANPVFDTLLPWFRNMYFWAPLYVFLAGWLVVNFGKKGWVTIGWILLTFALTDMISSSVIKPFVERVRPCNDALLVDYIRMLVRCGGGYSFTSSHATNHFGFAVITASIMRPYFRWMLPVMLLWAAAVSISQVYVGVHYPLDITAGAFLGSSIAFGMAYLYHKIIKLEK